MVERFIAPVLKTRILRVVDTGSERYQCQVAVVQNPAQNAFCLPGGKIVVYTGILPIAQNEAGLATVLGHEIAHATSRHGAQRVFQQNAVQIAMNQLEQLMPAALEIYQKAVQQ